ncbi:hypothetical protein BH10BDE1_BH10BDE1_05220 [soil metagenome]
MSPLILLAQAFFDHQARAQTENLKVAGLRAAEVGRRMAIAGVLFSLMGAFIFAAILIMLIDLGLQIDRGHGVIFSGLMISGSILILIGLVAAFAGWLVGRDPKAPVAPPPPAPSPVSELRPLLEAVAVGFLKEFLDHQQQHRADSSKRSNTATDEDES